MNKSIIVSTPIINNYIITHEAPTRERFIREIITDQTFILSLIRVGSLAEYLLVLAVEGLVFLHLIIECWIQKHEAQYKRERPYRGHSIRDQPHN